MASPCQTLKKYCAGLTLLTDFARNAVHANGRTELPAGKEKMILLKRAYDPKALTDGRRFLVERLWRRGIKKAELPLDGWLKEVAPSTGLRQWFGHDPAKWNEFRRRYRI